jgi:hypothetical protein
MPSPPCAFPGAPRIVLASYLLADGVFQDRLHASGADVVTSPLRDHPRRRPADREPIPPRCATAAETTLVAGNPGEIAQEP